jgi:hypothetical protein
MVAKHARYTARRAEIALSEALPRLRRPRQRVSRHLLHRPPHRSRKQPGRQIAIGGYPTAPRGFLPWRLSDDGPRDVDRLVTGPSSETLHIRVDS